MVAVLVLPNLYKPYGNDAKYIFCYCFYYYHQGGTEIILLCLEGVGALICRGDRVGG